MTDSPLTTELGQAKAHRDRLASTRGMPGTPIFDCAKCDALGERHFADCQGGLARLDDGRCRGCGGVTAHRAGCVGDFPDDNPARDAVLARIRNAIALGRPIRLSVDDLMAVMGALTWRSSDYALTAKNE